MRAENLDFNIFNGVGKSYLNREESGSSFYHYFIDDKSFLKRQRDLKEQYKIDRNKLINILEENNLALGADERVISNISKLKDSATLAVVTGQQAGFLTGPMYTVYKAVTAIKLAKNKEKELGVSVIPVFWVASEDHDFEEVANTYIATHKLERISIKRANHNKGSIGHMPLNENVEEMCRWFIQHFEEDEYKIEMEELINAALKNTQNLASFFSYIMNHLFKGHGLVIIDPLWHGIRDLQVDFMKHAFKNQGLINETLLKETLRLERLGFKGQIKPVENTTHLFKNIKGKRARLEIDPRSNKITAIGTTYALNENQFLKDLFDASDSFSMNVVLRPIGQDVLLPTLAYVAGPGEMNYYSQLQHVYGIFNKTMPIIYPRENFTIIEEGINNLAQKYRLLPDQMIRQKKHKVHEEVLNNLDMFGIEDTFNAFRKEIDLVYDAFFSEIEGAFPDISSIGVKNKGLIHYQLNYLKKKTKQQNRKQHKSTLNEIDMLLDHVSPQDHLQERCFNFLMYYSRHGDALIKWLVEDVELNIEHRLIYL